MIQKIKCFLGIHYSGWRHAHGKGFGHNYHYCYKCDKLFHKKWWEYK
jgi:hypothetical protein